MMKLWTAGIAVACLAVTIGLAAAAPLATGAGGEPLDVTLGGGAKIVPDAALKQDVLLLDGQPNSYAHCAAPADWGRLRNFRVEVDVRPDQIRASSIPIAWPGAFMIYISGENKPWVWVETDKGRTIYSSSEPIVPTQWTHLAFEYRADDAGLLWVNGRSVLTIRGQGPLKQGGPDLWFGRYYWKDPKDGKEYAGWMKGGVGLPRITRLPDDDRLQVDLSGMHNAINVSWGDSIVVGKGWRALNRPEHVAPFVAECKRLSVEKVFLRVDHEFIMNYCERRMPDDHWYIKALKAVQGDMIASLIKGCHEAGLKVYAYQTIFDLGSPTSVLYGGSTPFFWQSQFTIEHPEYVTESRDGKKRQWGVLCYAYPEARRYMIGIFEHIVGKWDLDGVYVCTRTHSYPAEFADQFGYNQPIVDEFKRRHGVDLRTQEFSRPQWWDLQGECLTQLLRELRAALKGKEMLIAIPRSDHIGPPYGNMRLDWRTWCQQKLVDGLVLGVTSGGWHYPNTMKLPGYIQSQQDNVGMRDLDYDLGEWFGPVCKATGVELYLARGTFYAEAERDVLKHPGMTGFATYF
ncbi:MAG: family 10 glycosylhydrolase [Armatimonadetes bacterium]|nr:family 10 glycosylhydrolase [Armatimonadota bacterium]